MSLNIHKMTYFEKKSLYFANYILQKYVFLHRNKK